MRNLYESVLILSPAFFSVALAGLTADLTLSSATVAAGTTALLLKASNEVFR